MPRVREQWTPMEDAFIAHSLAHGHGWARMSEALQFARTADAIRNRAQRLREGFSKKREASSTTRVRAPQPTRVSWTQAEDARLLYAAADFGMRWQRMEAELPGRNAHAIRNRYTRLLAEGMSGGDAAVEDAMLTIANYL